MKTKRLFTGIVAFVIGSCSMICNPIPNTFYAYSTDVSYGTAAPELIELYKTYYNNTSISELYLEETTIDYSSYCIFETIPDSGRIQFHSGSDNDIDLSCLKKIAGLDESELKLKYTYSTRTETSVITLLFETDNHEANYSAAKRITDALSKEYTIDSKLSSIDLERTRIMQSVRTYWKDIRKIDEFGIEAPLLDELTEKQILSLNKEISNNDFPALIDTESGGIVFKENTSEKQKFEFALWFKEKYGFYPYTSLDTEALNYLEKPYKHLPLYYTSIHGDVNNDSEFNVGDIVMFQKFLLGRDDLTNWNNGDLYRDGIIDSFDLVFFRKLLLSS